MSDRDIILSKIEEYNSTLLQDPKSTVFVELSDAYRQLNELDDALEVALKGTWELPQYSAGFAAVGRVYTQRKVYGKAEKAFYRALSLDQMCIAAYKGLARISKEQGDIAKASDILTKAIMLDPGDASLQKMIETLSAPAAQTTTTTPVDNNMAAEKSDSAVTKEPAMDQLSDGMKPITTATIADIYIEQGLYDKALQVYRELLGENPNDISVQQKISELEALMNSSAPAAENKNMGLSDTIELENADISESVVSGDNDTVIEKLNGWLETIQARRNRV